MIKFIVGTIILIALIGLILIIACAMNSINHVRCPKCGNNMDYIGNDDTFNFANGLPKPLKHHYYKCSKCGTTKII